MIEKNSFEDARKEVLERLEISFANGVIDLDEYEKRVDIALNTSIREDLLRISSDLVNLEDTVSGKTVPAGHKRQEDLIIGILSGVKRKGRWDPAKHSKVAVVMGSVFLDFTKTPLPEGVTEIYFYCLMGSLDIIVPEGIKVDVSGLPVMGSIETRVTIPEDKNCPVLKIRGIALMSSIDIRYPRRIRRRRKY